jgi:hypothetical protein
METVIAFIILIVMTAGLIWLNVTRKKWNKLDIEGDAEMRPLLGVVRPADKKDGK